MTLTTFPYDPLLDLAPWVGQRQATYTFQLINGVTGLHKGYINPIRGASLSHDTSRTIKRQLSMALGQTDTELVDPLVDRVLVRMVFPNGQSYPLGKYMFTDSSLAKYVNGRLGAMALNDEMFLVDQQIDKGIDGVNRGINDLLVRTLADLPITYKMEASFFVSSQAWTIGAGRGQILQDTALAGDLFSPWFDNDGDLRFIRAFDPALSVCDFDFDVVGKVIRAGIVESSDILTAPNRFIVISNTTGGNSAVPLVGVADVPINAPNSFANRGFRIIQTEDLQLTSSSQCQAVANNLALRSVAFERVTISTAPDPRHDSYNVVQWQGEKWLELSWSLTLQEGSPMSHLLRKAYT
jgi:hypothetical protein